MPGERQAKDSRVYSQKIQLYLISIILAGNVLTTKIKRKIEDTIIGFNLAAVGGCQLLCGQGLPQDDIYAGLAEFSPAYMLIHNYIVT